MTRFTPARTLALALGLAALGAHAADSPEKPPTAQQSRMGACNKDAADKKGDERKAFMKECLSTKPADTAASGTPQQTKMKACNADAKGKSGDERKAFMKDCLSAKG